MWVRGLLVAAFAIGTFITALLIASTITLALWIAAAISIACVIAVVAFRKTVRRRMPTTHQVIDHDSGQ